MTTSHPTSNRLEPVRPPPTSRKEIDKALSELSAHSQEWVDLPLKERIAIAEQVHKHFPKV